MFFVKKADGSLRMICDWRDLNRITIKNQACLPNTDDLFDPVQGSTYFTWLDLRSGCKQIRIEEAAIPKTAINSPLDHFQFTCHGIRTNLCSCNIPDPHEQNPSAISTKICCGLLG